MAGRLIGNLSASSPTGMGAPWRVFADDATNVHPLAAVLEEAGRRVGYGQYQFIAAKARVELWVVQQILCLDEVQRFLGAPLNVPYPAPWYGHVEHMRRIMRWGDGSITEFSNLATLAEIVLLTVRYGPFQPNFNQAPVAGAWALALRGIVEPYMYSYQALTGVELSADRHGQGGRIDATPPAVYLQGRRETARLRLRSP